MYRIFLCGAFIKLVEFETYRSYLKGQSAAPFAIYKIELFLATDLAHWRECITRAMMGS
jgi:hypothetical protein